MISGTRHVGNTYEDRHFGESAFAAHPPRSSFSHGARYTSHTKTARVALIPLGTDRPPVHDNVALLDEGALVLLHEGSQHQCKHHSQCL